MRSPLHIPVCYHQCLWHGNVFCPPAPKHMIRVSARFDNSYSGTPLVCSRANRHTHTHNTQHTHRLHCAFIFTDKWWIVQLYVWFIFHSQIPRQSTLYSKLPLLWLDYVSIHVFCIGKITALWWITRWKTSTSSSVFVPCFPEQSTTNICSFWMKCIFRSPLADICSCFKLKLILF